MILNFEAEIGDRFYDCDAGVTPDATGKLVAELLEVRLVGEDGASFVVVQHERLSDEVLVELKTLAVAEREGQIEAWVDPS